MATLYVRNIPADLYGQLQRWAAARGRSLNAEVIALLEEEAERRGRHREFSQLLQAYLETYPPKPGPPWASDVVIEERRRGHKPDFGY